MRVEFIEKISLRSQENFRSAVGAKAHKDRGEHPHENQPIKFCSSNLGITSEFGTKFEIRTSSMTLQAAVNTPGEKSQ